MSSRREGVVLLLEDDNGRIAMQFRDDVFRWGLFGGWTENGESPIETAVRELSEELSVVLPAARFTLKGVREVLPGVFAHIYHVAVGSDLETAVLREGLEWRFMTPEEAYRADVLEHHVQLLKEYCR